MSENSVRQARRVITGSQALRRQPASDAPLETQMLYGEIFEIESEQDGWAKGRTALDQYPGFVQLDALSAIGPLPTHLISVQRSFVYKNADMKSPVLFWLSMNAKLALTAHLNGFSRIEDLGWVYSKHTQPVGAHAADFVSVAELFTGTPYLWGGRDGLGVDCSGLLQIALQRAGITCPRDTWQQVELGQPVAVDLRALQRGDLIFWQGHVGMMRSAGELLHANAYHMQVVSEPLADAVARIAQTGSKILTVRRLPVSGG